MKIHVFTIIDESWDHGDLNASNEDYFISEELRDDYFENVLRHDYLQNEYLEEYELNNFCAKSGAQRWAYHISKGEKDIEIIESKNW